MNKKNDLNYERRGFLKVAGIYSTGLVLGFFVSSAHKDASAKGDTKIGPPNAFLHIAQDSITTVMINRLEFGQGIATGLAMVIAEELDADWSLMRAELAPAKNEFKDVMTGLQMTGGSSSLARSYLQYRQIGASARAMLISVAAKRWQVSVEECRTEHSFVLGPLGYKASFGSLADEAMQLAIPEEVALKTPSQFALIGQPTRRIDGLAKSTGRQHYGMDFQLPDMKIALVARAPWFGATVASFDAKDTLAVRGVLHAVKVPTDRGGSGVAVIADGYWPAKQGRDALRIKWNSSNISKVSSSELLASYKALAQTPGIVARHADVSRLQDAAKKMSAEYEFPYLAHAPMEPLNCVVDLTDASCTVWAGSQFQTFDHAAIVRTSGLAPEQVTLMTLMAGGGFGRRAVPTSDYIVEAIQVAKAYRQLGKSGPLKVIWSREDDIKGGYYRPAVVHRAELGFDQQGKIIAWDHTVVAQSILLGTPMEKNGVKNGVDKTMVEGLGEAYQLPMKISVHNVQANVPVLWFRSVGGTHTAFVMETLLDEAAHVAEMDPVAYRKQLLLKENTRHHAALDLVVEISGYGKIKLPKGHAFGVAMHESFHSIVAYVVEASVTKGVPKLHRVWAGVHCNQAVNPLSVEAQVQGAVLMALGMTLPGAEITLHDGIVDQQNLNEYILARMSDMPIVSVAIVPSNDAPTGMGEPGFPALAPAFANAIAKLTGKRLRKLPFNLAL